MAGFFISRKSVIWQKIDRMDIERIEKNLSEHRLKDKFTCKVLTRLSEDEVTGRKEQLMFRKFSFLLSNVATVTQTEHIEIDRELTDVGLSDGSEFTIDMKFKDFDQIWELWLEQQA